MISIINKLNGRVISPILSCCLFLSSLALSLGVFPEAAFARDNGKVVILTTFLPMTIFTRNVTKGAKNVEVIPLLANTMGCPHDYSLSPADAKKIVRADVMIANGHIEEFLGGPAKRLNPKMKILITSKDLKVIGEEAGKKHEHDARRAPDGKPAPRDMPDHDGKHESGIRHDRDHDKQSDGHHHHHHAVNPHTWVAPENAAKQVEAIGAFLAEYDPANKTVYAKNTRSYAARLRALQREMQKGLAPFKGAKIVTFHDAFDYLARSLGLRVVGYIETVPGQEPSAGQVNDLIKMIKKERVKAVFSEPQYPQKAAQLVARESGAKVYQLDPVAETSLANPPLDLYEKVMRDNVKVIKKALSPDRK